MGATSDIYTPDFVGLGKVFGCRTVRANNLDQLKSELVTAAGQARPTVIEVMQEDFAAGYPALQSDHFGSTKSP